MEAEALLQQLVPLVRREHLGLVLAGLCESVLPIWQKEGLDDERLCWCIASLRAWCCGEAVAQREYEAWMEALNAEADVEAATDDRRPDEDFSPEQLAAQEERWEAADAAEAKLKGAWQRGLHKGAEEAKEFIRLRVPFRTTRAEDWRFERGFIRSGGAVLRLDGWRLVDAVAQEELVKLTGSRAVEWDAAQERTGWILYQR